jgi:hypothetical protein
VSLDRVSVTRRALNYGADSPRFVRIIAPEDLVRGLQSAAVLVVAANVATLGMLFRDGAVRGECVAPGSGIVFEEAE